MEEEEENLEVDSHQEVDQEKTSIPNKEEEEDKKTSEESNNHNPEEEPQLEVSVEKEEVENNLVKFFQISR